MQRLMLDNPINIVQSQMVRFIPPFSEGDRRLEHVAARPKEPPRHPWLGR
jgi:hypothetical protein